MRFLENPYEHVIAMRQIRPLKKRPASNYEPTKSYVTFDNQTQIAKIGYRWHKVKSSSIYSFLSADTHAPEWAEISRPYATLKELLFELENAASFCQVSPLQQKDSGFYITACERFTIVKSRAGWTLGFLLEGKNNSPTSFLQLKKTSPALDAWGIKHGLEGLFKTRQKLTQRLALAIESECPSDLFELHAKEKRLDKQLEFEAFLKMKTSTR